MSVMADSSIRRQQWPLLIWPRLQNYTGGTALQDASSRWRLVIREKLYSSCCFVLPQHHIKLRWGSSSASSGPGAKIDEEENEKYSFSQSMPVLSSTNIICGVLFPVLPLLHSPIHAFYSPVVHFLWTRSSIAVPFASTSSNVAAGKPARQPQHGARCHRSLAPKEAAHFPYLAILASIGIEQ